MKSKLGLAIAITAEAFKNKVDKGGQPYILHCLYVMEHAEGNEDEKCAYVMHDLIEDTDERSEVNYTLELLANLGFSDITIEILKYVTHDPKDSYEVYIKNISKNQSAIKCKKSDLEHNSMISRLKGLSVKDHTRMEKYNKAYMYLSSKQR